MKKVLLILVDGMRPDALADIPQVEEMKTARRMRVGEVIEDGFDYDPDDNDL